jgi:putative addiction module killer protein
MVRDIQKLQLENGSVPFDDWYRSLLDKKMRAAVGVRLARVRLGNFGNHRHVGDGVCELKIDLGPGLRVYYVCDSVVWGRQKNPATRYQQGYQVVAAMETI